MKKFLSALSVLALLAACGDGNPFPSDEMTNEDTDADQDTDGDVTAEDSEDLGIGGDSGLLPGTTSPTSTASIVRYEAKNDENQGGFVTDVSYNSTDDTFTVDNLAFDGLNVYSRDSDVDTLSTVNNPTIYAVYEGAETVTDPQTGSSVDQFTYRALYGESANTVVIDGVELPVSRFAIVRTGSYVNYGFGGFIYERNGGVVLPTTGQAFYTGEYAGVRVFNNAGGLEYSSGLMDIAVDFNDFDEGDAVRGVIYDRVYFDINGNSIPTGTSATDIPDADVRFEVGPGSITENGEIGGQLGSFTLDEDGAVEVYESGTYYGIIGGDNADEVVGVVVLTGDDPRAEGVQFQETGGFILYREPPT
ncbi:hypothetical protein [Flavimaricola marinus]|uniref:Transferrin-binding protein B C-lobe/N-lobe beta barrel domain-containing protein n=1 Tax=Flavimaricola marinus TaxID=1819565 RepID=A0A238LKI5_9RHOB|nr:hypothetical protein [Flavimaricola marinus]SMY09466.1 hypothetical protein LOM8899_03633 [Flavimaricola marinus]